MDLSQYNYLDILLIGIVSISGLVGLARGLIKELLSLVAWGLSLYLAFNFAEYVSEQYIQNIFKDSPFISYLLSFGSIFLSSLFVLGLLNLLLTHLLIHTGLDGIDFLLGLIFGIIRGILICILFVFVAGHIFNIRDEKIWIESKTAPFFEHLTANAITLLPDDFKISLKSIKEFKEKENKIDTLSNSNQTRKRQQIQQPMLNHLESQQE